MNSFWRFTVLGLFATAGIALAICVVASSSPSADTTNVDHSASAPNAADESSKPANVLKLTVSQAAPQPSPVAERIAAPIANQPIPENNALAQNRVPTSGAPMAPSALLDAANLLNQTLGSNESPARSAAPSLPSLTAANPPAIPPQAQAEVMDQLRQQLQKALQVKQGAPANSETNDGDSDRRLGGAGLTPAVQSTSPAAAPKSKPRITKIAGTGDNNLAIHIQDADIRDVLELLSEQGSLNILPSPKVVGKVSASLNGVSLDTALSAILRSTGYMAKHDGKFIYVGIPEDFKQMDQFADSLGTRVYHLNYIRADDVKNLVTPLLTPTFGSISVTAPAGEGIASDSSKAGGNQFAGGEAILVHDFVAVLDQIEQVISDVDRKPAQVAIEAMILKVTLDDNYSFGVDFAFLRNNPNVHLFTGSPLGSLEALKPNGGLQFGYLDSSTAAFVSALETIGDTNIIASPRLMVIDKARAEILIGNQDGYVNSTVTETSTAQNVQFLETGAQLRLRPFISSDGLVRMEVHPELSTGKVEVTGGATPLTLPHKDVTQVTTNIMVPDGCTVVIGGLMREELSTITQQVPLLGSLPGVGFLFRHKSEETVKKEIIVLITPHIVCEPDACCEGDKAAAEFHRRQAVYADQMSPLGKRYLGRKYYRLAQAAWAHSDQKMALRFIDLAVHFDPESRAAINLRTDIWNGNLTGDHTLIHPALLPQGAVPMDGDDGLSHPSILLPGNGIQPEVPETLPPGRPSPMELESMRSRLPPSPVSSSQAVMTTRRPPGNQSNGPLDGEHLPSWVVDGLRQSPIGAAPTIAGAASAINYK